MKEAQERKDSNAAIKKTKKAEEEKAQEKRDKIWAAWQKIEDDKAMEAKKAEEKKAEEDQTKEDDDSETSDEDDKSQVSDSKSKLGDEDESDDSRSVLIQLRKMT